MIAMTVPKPKGGGKQETRDVPKPGEGEIRIRVKACGICHSDMFVQEGAWPGIQFPRIPGHEVAGIVDEVGGGVTQWKIGQRVGVGWHGRHCGVCVPCRKGDFVACDVLQITGISFDGGYAEYMIAPASVVAAIPEALSFPDAAPLLCAGITTFNALRHAGAMPGDVVAVEGIGGLGHLGVQFAAKMGFHTVAIGRGQDKKALAMQLGAHEYVDSMAVNPSERLQSLGGAKVILATAPSGKAMAASIDGLGVNGTLLAVAAPHDPMPVAAVSLIGKRRRIQGWPSGTGRDSEETLRFCALTGIRPMIERFPLTKAEEGYNRMLRGEVRFRAVLEP
jgi:D-arabinose 1-dehydrogenase-like Zn-dependent alcohol dehydrogenase